MKSIVLYYSRSGNTEKIAEKIHTDLVCDILKIIPEEAYGNYVASCLRVMNERGTGVTLQFVTDIPDLSIYDVIFSATLFGRRICPYLSLNLLRNAIQPARL